MNILLICITAVASATICILLKKYNPEYSMIIALISGILIFISILSSISPIISEIENLISRSGLPMEYAAILFKVLGICFLAQFASDACTDAGERALSSKVELAGKIIIILTALPLFKKIMDTAIILIG